MMQYSSFISDHIPCRYKSLIEDSSLKQLLFASDERPKAKPEFIAEFKNRVVPKAKGSPTKRRQRGEEEGSCRSISLKEVFLILTRGGKFTRVFRGWKLCSLIHDKPILYGLPDDPKARLHRSNSLYLSSYDDYPQLISKSAKLTNLHSPSSALSVSSLQRFSQRSAMKVRSCHGAENAATSRTQYLTREPVRPASSGPVADRQEDGLRLSSSEHHPAIDEVIDVHLAFKDAQDVDCYTANYREGYTYRKLHEQRPCSSSTPTAAMPPATTPPTTAISKTTRCPSPLHIVSHPLAKASLGHIEAFPTWTSYAHRSTSMPSSIRSTPISTRSTPTSTRATPTNNTTTKARERGNHGSQPDYKDQENEQKIPTRWPTNKRFRDLCDPQLTVTNTSPTEVAVLCRVTPGLQTLSSPSIPSNTNGKFGGKSKDRPYPFQLHISAASYPVQSTAKKAAKFNI